MLLDCYARDRMGGGSGLNAFTRNNLARELAKIPGAVSLLCYVDGQAAGLLNAFQGFSTFDCKPLINIHDIVVAEPFRGRGLARRLLENIEEIAKQRGCCKLTLEVLEGNRVAQTVYTKFGFAAYQLDPALGKALFWDNYPSDGGAVSFHAPHRSP